MNPFIAALLCIVLFFALDQLWEKSTGTSLISTISAFIWTQDQDQSSKFKIFYDRFTTLEEIQEGLHEAGLESSNLIIGIDFTGSNEYQGRKTFGGRNLHTILPDLVNPYQAVISIIGRTLEKFDEDGQIPAFGFGDITTKDYSVFPFMPDPIAKRYCTGVQEVLSLYNDIARRVKMSGPTCFAPLIDEAIKIVTQHGRCEYHILLIVADGQVVQEFKTAEAIVRASNYPLSIIMVGVGDGPWDMMGRFDDRLPARKFDNFQFVNFNAVCEEARRRNMDPDVCFSIAALMEIPDQYRACKHLGLLGKSVPM